MKIVADDIYYYLNKLDVLITRRLDNHSYYPVFIFYNIYRIVLNEKLFSKLNINILKIDMKKFKKIFIICHIVVERKPNNILFIFNYKNDKFYLI